MKTKLFFLMLMLFFSLQNKTHAQMFWNQAANFDNETYQGIYASHSSSLNISSSYTIQAWINPAFTFGNTILEKGSYSGGYGMRFNFNNSAGKLYIISGGYNVLQTRSVIPKNKWTHITAVYDAGPGRFYLYLNGVLDTLCSHPTLGPQSNTERLWVGVSEGWHDIFHGQMDEVRIWNRVLTANEIRDLMYVSLAVPGTGIYNGLVLSYTFQTRSSPFNAFTLFDWSRNGNLGTNGQVFPFDLGSRPSSILSYNTAISTGTGSWFAVPSNSSVNELSAFTAEAWVYTSNPASGNYKPVISKHSNSSHTGYALGVSSYGKIQGTINNQSVAGNTVLPVNQWVHLSWAVSASAQAKFYVNGVLDQSFNYTGGTPLTNNDSLFIGARVTHDSYFNGYIDEARVSNYQKTQQQIIDGMYISYDNANDPNPAGVNTVFNFDGNSNTNCDANFTGYFRGGAKFTTAGVYTQYAPVSPLIRGDGYNFPAGWFLKQSNRRIPQANSSGFILDDSLVVSETQSINDLNFYVALNHTYNQDLVIYLISPASDTLMLYNRNYTIGKDNLVTVFDDQADSSLVNGRYVTFSPAIKPVNSLNAKFSGQNPQGIWKIRINDYANGDTGRVYCWGIQVNSAFSKTPNSNTTVPGKFALMQNYPNPFNPSTAIKFDIPREGVVTMKIYDLLGREAAVLLNEKLSAGAHEVIFDGSNFSSGVYFYKLEASGLTDTKKMVLVK